MNQENFMTTLFSFPISTLRNMAQDIRAQEQIGLMTSKEAHDRINCITAVMLSKQVDELEKQDDY